MQYTYTHLQVAYLQKMVEHLGHFQEGPSLQEPAAAAAAVAADLQLEQVLVAVAGQLVQGELAPLVVGISLQVCPMYSNDLHIAQK